MVCVGETVSHFRIIEELGRGGMGVVYRARDERLSRDVALKVLTAGMFADETARGRFRREALALSQLNHPNIAVVYEFDNENGVDFLAMEYVAGQTLADKVSAGPLAEEEVITLGMQIAEALEDAHEHGIIHRDLKPGNVIVTAKGRAKVLDFGLAKFSKPAEVDVRTASSADSQSGMVAGTIPYMPPEQLHGRPTDPRTDIYALGAVLYEMATGQRAFPGESSIKLIASILNEPPEPPRQLNNNLSPGLEVIILKALEKKPDERYPSVKQVLEDLGRLSAACSVLAAPSTKIQSIAVLPLANFSGDPKQEYFADGMTDELITNLGKISSLRVISRTTAMRFKGTTKTLPEIARQLNVDAIVEGSVQCSGDRVRISAQLIEARREKHLWAESYERELRDVLALQSEVARAITHEISATVTVDELERLATAHAVNPEAYRLYLEGRYQFSKRTPSAFKKSLQLYKRALKLDPDYALAYAGLAESYGILPFYGGGLPKSSFPKARETAQKALALDDSLSEGHAALGFVLFYGNWIWMAAEKEFKRAIEIKPNYVIVHHWYAEYLSAMGRHEEAIAEVKRAQELDPLSPLLLAVGGEANIFAGRYDEAVAQCRKALE
ncbi:MAG: protein kinase domain-containing protein, partial [Deltaproteobacteria bacterium]